MTWEIIIVVFALAFFVLVYQDYQDFCNKQPAQNHDPKPNNENEASLPRLPPRTYEQALERLTRGVYGQLKNIENCGGITIIVEYYK